MVKKLLRLFVNYGFCSRFRDCALAASVTYCLVSVSQLLQNVSFPSQFCGSPQTSPYELVFFFFHFCFFFEGHSWQEAGARS